jgi:mannose/fructose-specific phosphotransferase system component IIA
MKSFTAFILAHEDLAFALKNTVEKITGSQHNIFPYSNKVESLPIIVEKISAQMDNLNSEIIFIFVDLVGGSCWSLANMIQKKYPDIFVIGGVNLPMLFSLIINYDSLAAEELINKITEDSKKGIKIISRNKM